MNLMSILLARRAHSARSPVCRSRAAVLDTVLQYNETTVENHPDRRYLRYHCVEINVRRVLMPKNVSLSRALVTGLASYNASQMGRWYSHLTVGPEVEIFTPTDVRMHAAAVMRRAESKGVLIADQEKTLAIEPWDLWQGET